MTLPAPVMPVLNGVSRQVTAGTLISGISATVRPSTANDAMGAHGMHGSPLSMGLMGAMSGLGYGYGTGLGYGYGGYSGYGGYGMPMGGQGALGMGGPGKLDASIEFVVPVAGTYLLVFTETAPQSELSECPAGPVLTGTESQSSPGFGHGFGGSMGMMPGYGFGGSLGMLGGHGMAMGMGAGMAMQPDFGIISEINAQVGSNTFQITGLGSFTDLNQLSGRGIALCTNVEIGFDGRPACTEPVVLCAKLGYTTDPEPLTFV